MDRRQTGGWGNGNENDNVCKTNLAAAKMKATGWIPPPAGPAFLAAKTRNAFRLPPRKVIR
jgi:hypothetical protein